MFAEQSVPGYTRLEMINLAKAYFGLSGMANSFHKHELVEYFADPSRRPSIQAVVEDRREQAGAARTARLETITKGLKRRPGRWRFAAVARATLRRLVWRRPLRDDSHTLLRRRAIRHP